MVHYQRNSTIYCMMTFTDREIKLVRKLSNLPSQAILQIQEPCLLHSYCNPLPLFRVYKIDDTTFEAQWNEHHNRGTTQHFRFEEAM